MNSLNKFVNSLVLVATAVFASAAAGQSTDFPFPIPEEAKSRPVVVTVHLDQARPIRPDFFGYNTQLLAAAYKYDSPMLVEIVRDLGAGNLRFSPSRASNFYNPAVDRAVVPDVPSYDAIATYSELRRLAAIMEEKGFTFDFPGFAMLAKATGATPILIVGLNGATPEQAVAWITDAKARGLPTPLVELGYQAFVRGTTTPDSETVQDYIALAKAMTSAIKAAHPDVRIAVNFAPRMLSHPRWNPVLAQEDFFDATTHHLLIGGYTTEEIVDIGLKEILSAEQYVDELADRHTKLFPDKKAWVVEWAPNAPTRQRFPHNGASGLMMANVAARMIERSDFIEVAAYTPLTTRPGLFDITTRGKRVIFGDYLTARLIGRVGIGADHQIPVTTTPTATEALPIQPVLAAATRKGDQLRLLVINRLPIPQTVTIAGAGENPAIAATTLRLINLLRSSTPTDESTAYVNRSGQGSVEVPGLSVSVFEISISR
jgi:hypothetical protein